MDAGRLQRLGTFKVKMPKRVKIIVEHVCRGGYNADLCNSFLFPALDSTYAIIVATLLLTALVVVIVACARTVYYSGGCAAILPFKWHLKMERKKRMKGTAMYVDSL